MAIRKYGLLFLLFFAFIFYSSETYASEKLESVSIQLKWFHQFQFAGYYAAREKGFYADEGLDVVIKEYNPDKTSVQTVLDNKATYGVSDASLLLQRSKGKPVVLLKQIFQHSLLVFISLKDSGIISPYQMMNKKVMFEPESGTPITALLQDTLGNLNKIIQVPFSYDYDYEDIVTGQVDVIAAYITAQPFFFKQRGIPINIINPQSYGIDFYGDNLFTTETEINLHPERVDKMIRATLKGWRYALNHPEEIIDLIISKYKPNLTREQLAYEARMTHQVIRPDFTPIGTVTLKRYEDIGKIYQKSGLAKGSIDLSRFIYKSQDVSTLRTGLSSPLISLTPKEKAWLDEHHTVRARVSDSPPLHFFDGKFHGISVDYLNLIAKRAGFKVQYITDIPWSNALNHIKNHKIIDLLLTAKVTPERQKFIAFTKDYFLMPWVIFTQKNRPVKTIEDLNNKTVSVERDFVMHKKLVVQYPGVKLLVKDTSKDAIEAVATGEADAYIGNLTIGLYIIQQNNLINIKVSAPTPFDNHNQAMGIRNDWPELSGIINKTFAIISPEEHTAIRKKWLSNDYEKWLPLGNELASVSVAVKDRPMRTIALILTIMGVLTLVMWMLIRLAGDRLPVSLRTRGSQIVGIIVASAFLTMIVTVAWFALQRLERQTRVSTGESLEVIVQTAQSVLGAWIHGEKEHIEMFASDQRLVDLVTRLLHVPRTRDQLLDSKALGAVRRYLKPLHEYQHGFFIISPDLTNIGSMRDTNIGWRNLIAEHRPGLLQRAFSGETVFIPPIQSDVPLKDETGQLKEVQPTMFIATPVKDEGGTVIAVMTLRYDPGEYLEPLCRISRFGQTGETYAFDKKGLLLSQIRFTDDIVGRSSLSPGENGIVGLRLSDPGGNLLLGHRPAVPRNKQPLTSMAASAISGQSGVDVKGYRDYRGIKVLGAWQWDKEMQIGITTEINEKEALAVYRGNLTLMIGGLLLVALLTIVLVGFLTISSERINRSLRRAKEEWEQIAEDRMAKLRESEDRFRGYFVNAPVGVAVMTPERDWIDVNEHFCKMLGYTREELLQKTWSQIRDAEDRTNAQAQFQRMLAGEIEYYDLDAIFISKTSNPVYTNLAIACRRNEDRSISRILFSMIDITGRKKAENAVVIRAKWAVGLQKAGEELSGCKTVEEAANVACRSIVDFGDMTHAWVGVQDSDGINVLAVHGQYGDVVHERIQRKDASCEAEAIRTGHSIVTKDVIKNPPFRGCNAFAEQCGFGSCAVFPVFSGKDCVGTFTIRSREKGNQSLIVSITPLVETLVLQLGHVWQKCIVEKRLKKSQIIAEEATQAKSYFLSNMSHEIRTPMNAIIGLLHLALKTNLDPKQKDYLKKIQLSSQSLLSIINDILDISKIEAGKMVLDNISFRLDEILENLTVNLSEQAKQKELEFLYDFSDKVPARLKGDPTRLNQVVMNLATNAIKFTDSGQVVIAMNCVRKENESIELQVSVKDTGIGISREQISMLFQPFTQADSSTTRKFGGTGLGLSISKQFIEMMGGELSVESVPGKGSTFSFTALLTIDETRSEQRIEKQKALHGVRVLVVDDSTNFRSILSRMLEIMGIQTVCLESGKAALEEIHKAYQGSDFDPFDLIISDWKMPGMDGLELFKQLESVLAEAPQEKRPAFIIATGFAYEGLIDECRGLGLSSILEKPMTRSRLFAAIAEAVGKDKLIEEIAKNPSDLDEATQISLKGAQILLVEDNELNQQVAREILEKAGLKVTVANNGSEGLDWVRKAEFDAVLMDIQMPVMSGYEATREIRKEARFKDLPILAMTAGVMLQDREKAFEAGMNDHISKPIDFNELFNKLCKWVNPGVRDYAFKNAITNAQVPGERERCYDQEFEGLEVNFPDALPGIDVKSALYRFGGNQKLLTKTLVKFCLNHASAVEKISKALTAGDRKTAIRMAHTLKGLSGTIGANELQEVARELESAIKDETKELEFLVDRVSTNLNIVVSSITPFVDIYGVEQPGGVRDTVDKSMLIPLLENLKTLLEENDMDALEKLSQLEGALLKSDCKDEFISIKQSLERYDADKALQHLTQIMKKL